MEPGFGSYSSGTLSGIQTYGDYTNSSGYYALYDTATTPGFIVNVGFTSVTQFNKISLDINYAGSSSHTIDVDLYNWNTSSWETVQTYSGLGTFTTFQPGVIDSVPFINAGIVSARLYHLSAGFPSHYTQIDYFALEDSIAGGQGPRGTQGTQGRQGTQGVQGVQGIAGPVAGSANQVVYKDASNNPTGSNNLTFDGSNLFVGGNITIGGTTAFLAVNELKVKDKDIVLGITTDAFGNDVSTDTTANHGGIAIASTTGNYLVPLQKIGINSLPETYKQFMWVSAGTFGVGTTDAWLSNQPIGIGSTQVPTGVVLSVGGPIKLDSSLRDIYNSSGNSGSILISTGAGVSWTTPYAAGLQGTQGAQGTQGTQGTQGVQNAQGTQGLQGNQGIQGAQGLQGSQGLQATQGVQGLQGSQGLQATQGLQGTQGTQGSQGLQSAQGLQGVQGLQSTQGLQGASVQGAAGSGGGGGGGSIAILDDTSTNNTFYVGIASTTTGNLATLNVSSSKLTFNPSTGNLVAGGTVTANSDERLKTNVKTIPNALEKVLSLRGVEYDRIDNGDHQIGVIAQEVEQIIPEVVYPKSPSPDYETKSVAYANLVGLLIEAVKELNKKIEEK